MQVYIYIIIYLIIKNGEQLKTFFLITYPMKPQFEQITVFDGYIPFSHHFWCSNPMKKPIFLAMAPGNPGLAIGLTKPLGGTGFRDPDGPDLLKILVFSPKSTQKSQKSRDSCFFGWVLDGFLAVGCWKWGISPSKTTVKTCKNHGFAASMVLFLSVENRTVPLGKLEGEARGGKLQGIHFTLGMLSCHGWLPQGEAQRNLVGDVLFWGEGLDLTINNGDFNAYTLQCQTWLAGKFPN